jgi:hypothetical protein
MKLLEVTGLVAIDRGHDDLVEFVSNWTVGKGACNIFHQVPLPKVVMLTYSIPKVPMSES